MKPFITTMFALTLVACATEPTEPSAAESTDEAAVWGKPVGATCSFDWQCADDTTKSTPKPRTGFRTVGAVKYCQKYSRVVVTTKVGYCNDNDVCAQTTRTDNVDTKVGEAYRVDSETQCRP